MWSQMVSRCPSTYQLVVREEDVVSVPQACDDVADVPDDGGEHQHGDEQVGDHEQILLLPFRQRGVSHRGENLSGEPEAVEVLAAHGRKLLVGDVGVDPAITPEADVAGEREVETGVPVDQHEDVDHELGDAEGVGVGRPRLHAVQGLVEPGQTQEAVDAHHGGLDAEDKVEKVGGQQRGHVPQESLGVQVALLQLNRVQDQDALVQVTCRGSNAALCKLQWRHASGKIGVYYGTTLDSKHLCGR